MKKMIKRALSLSMAAVMAAAVVTGLWIRQQYRCGKGWEEERNPDLWQPPERPSDIGNRPGFSKGIRS